MKAKDLTDFGQIHSSPKMIVLSSLKDGSFIDANQAFLKTLEFDRSELTAKYSLNFLIKKDRETVEYSINTLNPIQNLEIVVRSKSGKVVVGIMSCSFVEVENQLCLMAIVTDITKRKFLEVVFQKLRELEQFGRSSKMVYN